MLVTLKYKIGNESPILIYARYRLISLQYTESATGGLHAEADYEIPDHEATDVECVSKEWWETLIVYFNEKRELVCEVVTLVDHLEEKIKGEFKFYSPNLIAEGEKYGGN